MRLDRHAGSPPVSLRTPPSFEPTTDGTKPEANVVDAGAREQSRRARSDQTGLSRPARRKRGDSLSMFLPENQREPVFSAAGNGKVDGRQALMIDYRPRDAGKPGISWKDGKDDCLSGYLPVAARGCVWRRSETADACWTDTHLAGMLDSRYPRAPEAVTKQMDAHHGRAAGHYDRPAA